jgi:hypothetical protein
MASQSVEGEQDGANVLADQVLGRDARQLLRSTFAFLEFRGHRLQSGDRLMRKRM